MQQADNPGEKLKEIQRQIKIFESLREKVKNYDHNAPPNLTEEEITAMKQFREEIRQMPD